MSKTIAKKRVNMKCECCSRMGAVGQAHCLTVVPRIGHVGICFKHAWRVLDKEFFHILPGTKRRMPQKWATYPLLNNDVTLLGVGGVTYKLQRMGIDPELLQKTINGKGVGSDAEGIKAAIEKAREERNAKAREARRLARAKK